MILDRTFLATDEVGQITEYITGNPKMTIVRGYQGHMSEDG
jgi:hypothetical protein